MSDQSASPVATRNAVSLRTGSKVCILLALIAVATAAYFYFVPSNLRTQTGGVFGCGSPASPADGDFARSVCQNVTDGDRFRSYLMIAVALIVGVLGSFMFGVDRRTVERRPRGIISEDGQFQAAPRHGTVPEDDPADQTADQTKDSV